MKQQIIKALEQEFVKRNIVLNTGKTINELADYIIAYAKKIGNHYMTDDTMLTLVTDYNNDTLAYQTQKALLNNTTKDAEEDDEEEAPKPKKVKAVKPVEAPKVEEVKQHEDKQLTLL